MNEMLNCFICNIKMQGDMCPKCRVKKFDRFKCYYLIFDYKEKCLAMYFYMEPVKFILYDLLLMPDGLILKLDFWPNITPFNVQEKLPTLLTFS